MKKKLIVIAGPTAAGKTAISISLAQELQTEILSADSRQCYREMRIGTARPTEQELQQAKHYFIASHSVTENISAADYERIGLEYLEQIFAKSDIAIVCGGTGLYIKALCEGLDEMPETDAAIAEEVNQLYKHNGLSWLQQAVAAADPAFYATGEIQNPARLIRALAFVRTNAQSITIYRNKTAKTRHFDIVKIGLELPREQLYDRINHRVDKMMKDGLEEEARILYPQRQLKNLQTVGYSELFDLFEHHFSHKEAVEKIKQHTRNYAKRQMTWFKKDDSIHWLNGASETVLQEIKALVL